MEITNLLDFSKRSDLRAWLTKNHKTEKCCWVVMSVRPKPNRLLYLDVVEEAICFGWIDSTTKKISETKTAQRLSPRRKQSHWTELNKERARRLGRLGLMTEPGREALPDMRKEVFVIDSDILNRLKQDDEVYQNFLGFPELYRRIRIDNIQSVKDLIPELFEKRLTKFIQMTKQNKMYGDWDDHGRLNA